MGLVLHQRAYTSSGRFAATSSIEEEVVRNRLHFRDWKSGLACLAVARNAAGDGARARR
jgi:hypothetical protein